TREMLSLDPRDRLPPAIRNRRTLWAPPIGAVLVHSATRHLNFPLRHFQRTHCNQSKSRWKLKPDVKERRLPSARLKPGRLPKTSRLWTSVFKISRLRTTRRAFQLPCDGKEENIWNGWRPRCRERRAGTR